MSADLPEEIACLYEASNNLISSLPEVRRGWKMGVTEDVHGRVMGRTLRGVLGRANDRMLRGAWLRIANCRRREVRLGLLEVRRVVLLSSGFRRWRNNIHDE